MNASPHKELALKPAKEHCRCGKRGFVQVVSYGTFCKKCLEKVKNSTLEKMYD